jgi:glycosyltransferase involved in cell wall biosynthesis
MKKIKILAWPAYSNKHLNPYNYILYKSIEKHGVAVEDFSFNAKNMLKFWVYISKSYQIYHFHWPHNILVGNSRIKAFCNLIVFYSFIKFLKLMKKKIIWTVHNMEAHDKKYDRMHQWVDKILYRNVDGFISLNKVGINAIKEKLEKANKQKVVYTPHPHYKYYYKNSFSRECARQKLGIKSNKYVFLFLGQIKAYKNVIGLVKAFKSLEVRNKFLLIAGKIDDEIKDELFRLTDGANDIILYPSFVHDDDLQLFLNSADLVVTPYNAIFNSGSIFLNLSYSKPTLAPALWALPELQDTVGKSWIKMYSAPLCSNHLMKYIEDVHELQGKHPDLSPFEPDSVALQSIDFYKYILSIT